MSENKKQLLFSLSKAKGDFVMEVFRAGGKGGQHQNKTSSGVRIRHPESGAVGESREERSQNQNKKLAFERCVNSDKFKLWHKMAVSRAIIGKAEYDKKINEAVDKMMSEDNLIIEYFDPDQQS